MSAAADDDLRQALVDSATGWLAEAYGLERRRRTLAGSGFDRDAWREMAAFGWFSIAVPEELGGSGLGLGDLAALMRTIGAANLPEPVAAVAGVAAPLLVRAAREPGTSTLVGDLNGLLAGERIVVLAHAEPASGFDRSVVTTRAVRDGASWRLDGEKSAVEGGAQADLLLVSARIEAGIALFRVEPGAPGVTVTPFRSLDGRALADLRFEGARLPADALLPVAEPEAAIDAALERGALLTMAEAVGAMEVLVTDTVAYLKTRRQFGHPIGKFQVLQHRAVDMQIALEEARAVVDLAAEADAGDPAERRRAVATAKVVGARAARRISREAVQLHGGIGITEELRVSHLFRRLVVAESLYGDRDYYLRRFQDAAAA
ncbi:acyl-CoA dehydrogenase [Methylobacterium currus]|uniref:acyl-CoA dehydrogenase family protein n=1 Tax=Methylobacterium currus TaxID=2051553 RepID=UPI001E35518A|nr:acyl-CoA dehydrogenase [Methylobacterium currus]UHC17653.1 acyl-CoA dehydrogenase [Methylobacterium currus]